MDGPLFNTWAAPGYGIHEAESWSLFRMFRLVVVLDAIAFIFVGFWLALHDKHDLQTAFVLVANVNAFLSVFVALPQYLAG